MTVMRETVSPTEGQYQRQRRERIVCTGIHTCYWVNRRTPSIHSTTLRVWVLTTTAGIELDVTSELFGF